MRTIIGFLLSVLIAQSAHAIIISPNTVINSAVNYTNTIVDLTQGNFIVRNGGELIITNSKVIGQLSPDNQSSILVESGSLKMRDNDVQIYSPDIKDHPDVQSLEYFIRLEQAKVQIENNKFKSIHPFRVGLLMTSINIATSNFVIKNNEIEGFHGALYLLNTNNALIDSNKLSSNSYGNIVVSGKDGKIIDNRIYFSGRNHLGNAMDIINSDNIYIYQNLLFNPTCHGIYVFLSQNITMDENTINSGITYAITLLSNEELSADHYVTNLLGKKKLTYQESKNIVITNNYMSQNRYGIQASDVSNLDIENNYFQQRFNDKASRLFWTNNDMLLKNVVGLTWQNNYYKEAFTQVNGDSNANTDIMPYPQSGGVQL